VKHKREFDAQVIMLEVWGVNIYKTSICYSKHGMQIQIKSTLLKISQVESLQQLLVTGIPPHAWGKLTSEHELTSPILYGLRTWLAYSWLGWTLRCPSKI